MAIATLYGSVDALMHTQTHLLDGIRLLAYMDEAFGFDNFLQLAGTLYTTGEKFDSSLDRSQPFDVSSRVSLLVQSISLGHCS